MVTTSPEELIENATAQGLLALGITDHDIQPPAQLALSGGRSFSTNTWVDDVHICGYSLDWSHPDLPAEVDAAASGGSDYLAVHKKGEHKIRQIGERGLTVQEFLPIYLFLKLPDPRHLNE